MKKHIIIIGGGIAGMQCACLLRKAGAEVTLVERENHLGGKVNGWYILFPTFTPTEEVLEPLKRAYEASGARTLLGVEVKRLSGRQVELADGQVLEGDAVVVATGMSIFDARRKEEYGYGIYDNVYTSVDLERMFKEGKVTLRDGSEPRRIAILHCVGSRDEKVCRLHCSRICCVTGVKQAIELKQRFPSAEIFNFYMDIRMFGPGYERLYRTAQMDYNIHFVRGRISEAAPTFDNRIQIKAEDTLTGRPLKMSVDMLILLVGTEGESQNLQFEQECGLTRSVNGFLEPKDLFKNGNISPVEGVFYAGTVTSQKSIGETLNDAIAAAEAVKNYLKIE